MAFLLNKINYLTIYGFITVLLLCSAGCKNDSVVDPASNNNISIGYFNENAAVDNTLVLTEAKFILRKIVLEGGDGGDHSDCDVKLGPFVVYLDLSQKVVIAALAKIPPGNYHEIKFQVHKLNPNESVGDPEFMESTSRRFSVIAKGTYNGELFIFKSDISFTKEIEFEHLPVSINEATVLNITVRLDVASWFILDGVILDPADPDNAGIINHNIKRSFKRAFRDMNCDGDPD